VHTGATFPEEEFEQKTLKPNVLRSSNHRSEEHVLELPKEKMHFPGQGRFLGFRKGKNLRMCFHNVDPMSIIVHVIREKFREVFRVVQLSPEYRADQAGQGRKEK
jgi:hypothetical protein